MRDRHFMEDENELPFLVSRKKGPERYGSGKTPIRQDFENFPFDQFESYMRRMLMAPEHIYRIVSSLEVKAKNCTASIHLNDDVFRLELFLKNEYLSSRFTGRYDLQTRVMDYYQPFHSYHGLESLGWFKSEVKRIQREIKIPFLSNGGGYEYHWNNGNLTVLDNMDVLAYFHDGGSTSDYYSYRVDFKNRRLVEYNVHPWHEFFDPL